jgi:hypothetical protein
MIDGISNTEPGPALDHAAFETTNHFARQTGFSLRLAADFTSINHNTPHLAGAVIV